MLTVASLSSRLNQTEPNGAAVDVGPDLLGVGARAAVLAGHLLNSFVRNSESHRERLFSRYQHDTNKNTNKSSGWDRIRTNGDGHRCTRKRLFFKGFRVLRGRLRTLWNGLEQPSWCPWPESNQHSLRNSILSRARLPVPPQGPSTGTGQKRPPQRSGRTIITGPPGSTRAEVIGDRLDSRRCGG